MNKYPLQSQWLDDRQQELCFININGIKLVTAVSCLKTQLKERVIYEIGKRHLIERSVTEIGGFSYGELAYELVFEDELSADIKIFLELNLIEFKVLSPVTTNAQ